MEKILIKSKSRSYEYIFGKSIFEEHIIDSINSVINPSLTLVIIDENVFNLHGNMIRNTLSELSSPVHITILKAGERSKSLAEFVRILTLMAEKGFNKDSLIISIGGGVTGDVSGFIASVYMRGISIIHIPTTIIAAIDSSLGGKTGINFSNKKNILGTFHQPHLIFFDIDFLKTLPEEEINSGMGELVKYGFLGGFELFQKLLENFDAVKSLDYEKSKEIFLEAIQIKSGIVLQDEKEAGIRKILNLGHTFAHAFESVSDFAVSHGEAVNAGILCAAYLARRKDLIDTDMLEDMIKLPLKLDIPGSIADLNPEEVFETMKMDKKNRQGKVKFVLPCDYGQMVLDMEAKRDEIVKSILELQKVI